MSTINFEYKGIGQILKSGKLKVPKNQREYSWTTEHVEDLCHDIALAIREGQESYFLGTIVLTQKEKGRLEVVDGQQRLATCSIVLAVIRDLMNDDMTAAALTGLIEDNYLISIDIDTEEEQANLILNDRDHTCYLESVLKREEIRPAKPRVDGASNKRIVDAKRAVRKFFNALLLPIPESERKDLLKTWINFLDASAKLITLKVPDELNAYVMFETLNDRGLKVSKADLVKNYLYAKSGDQRLEEVQRHWGSMIATLEASGQDDSLIDYLRHLCTISYGLTREKELFRKIKDNVNSQATAVTFSAQLKDFSIDFSAMLSRDHAKWNTYPPSIRNSLRTLAIFNVTQVRHLSLAVAHYFPKKEADKAFKMIVSWIVRLTIASAGKVGRVEDRYAKMAHRIHGDITFRTANALADDIIPDLATDDEFRKAFAIARVKKPTLSRYYLETIERQLIGENTPALIPNEDTNIVNLEHVVPQNPAGKWGEMSLEEASSIWTRLGNQTLLKAKENSLIGNQDFTIKKPVLEESCFQISKKMGSHAKWTGEDITAHQEFMAEHAVKCWPLRY